MIKNHIRYALRLLWSQKIYSLVNILGLAVGFACCLLIGVYIYHEWSFDRYHTQGDRLYRLANQVTGATYENGIAKVAGPWGPEAGAAIPEIEGVCRFVFMGQTLMRYGRERNYESGGLFVDSTVFDLFSWQLLEGDPRRALVGPNAIVLTESMASRYFGDEDALGKVLTLDNEAEYQVTGVLADVPPNSHFTFDFLASMASYHHPDMNDWVRWNQFYTYLLLRPGAEPALVADKVDALLSRHLDPETAAAFTPFLQPLTSIHLHSNLFREMNANSAITYIYLFGGIAFFILVIAGLNFINLATARALSRAREVGVRKVAGATRPVLVRQFLLESLLVSGIAGALAVLLAQLLLPSLNNFLGSELTLDWFGQDRLAGGLLLMVVLMGLLSGSYPAVVLSAFQPVKVLKGRLGLAGGGRLRQVLVVVQFSIAVFLLVATLVIGGQLDYIRNKNLGFNKEQVVVIPLPTQESIRRLATLKEELAVLPGVLEVAASANRPGGSDYGVPYVAVGLPASDLPAMRCLVVDPNFLDTYQMEIAAGRKFDEVLATDSLAYLINEEAARQLGWSDPVGQQLAMPAIGRPAGPIVGVVRDFHFRSMHEKLMPLYFFIQPAWFSQLSVRLDAGRMQETLAAIEAQWAAFEPDYPFDYFFFDESYENLYLAEQRSATLIRWFTVVAVLITCLGLFGLSIFTGERRSREISIRKVLGASTAGILGLLTRDFLKLVLIAFVVGAPLAWLAARQWLEGFAFHTSLHWWYFALAGLVAVAVAVLTVSWQSLRAAMVNPVENLRRE